MSDRRSLVEGVKPLAPTVDPKVEADFVYQSSAKGAGAESRPGITPVLSRSPLSTRIRTDFGKALKHASLDRQLRGVEPSTVCDILEQALEPWLKANGYLP